MIKNGHLKSLFWHENVKNEPSVMKRYTTRQLPIEKYTPTKHLKKSFKRLLMSSRCMTNYMKACSYLHAHFTETMKVVENLLLK